MASLAFTELVCNAYYNQCLSEFAMQMNVNLCMRNKLHVNACYAVDAIQYKCVGCIIKNDSAILNMSFLSLIVSVRGRILERFTGDLNLR